jgi:hypothetical protein
MASTMSCGSGYIGTDAEELGDGADEEGTDELPAEPPALLEGTGAFTEPAKPCTASTITSGGGRVS